MTQHTVPANFFSAEFDTVIKLIKRLNQDYGNHR
jgi:hypothetical protein